MGAVRSWLWFEASKYSTGQDDQDGFWTRTRMSGTWARTAGVAGAGLDSFSMPLLLVANMASYQWRISK